MTVETIITILREALKDPTRLTTTITEFQRVMWAEEAEGPEEALVVLRDLAIDLDYYEPNPAWRAEDSSFFDQHRALAEIREALAKIMPS